MRKNPNFDGICFHSQQCAEKYLKAHLSEANIEFAKIHDLVALLELVLPVEPTWEAFREDLAFLSDYAVNFRYRGKPQTETRLLMRETDAGPFGEQREKLWDYRH